MLVKLRGMLRFLPYRVKRARRNECLHIKRTAWFHLGLQGLILLLDIRRRGSSACEPSTMRCVRPHTSLRSRRRRASGLPETVVAVLGPKPWSRRMSVHCRTLAKPPVAAYVGRSVHCICLSVLIAWSWPANQAALKGLYELLNSNGSCCCEDRCATRGG